MPITVIAGKLRGRQLKGIPAGKDPREIRPILARIKKSLFDIIRMKIPGSYFLDLYSGTGAVGIEALSRGAKYAVFVDSDFIMVKSLKDDLIYLGLLDSSAVFQRDIIHTGLEWLAGRFGKKKFDIIFIGPPYKGFYVDKTLELIKAADLLKKNGLIIAQHHKKEVVRGSAFRYKIFREEKYGDSVLTFLVKNNERNSN
ncbi:MAG: 16S rRNA (guanine(966)-N(2))-methyltransferase RsmD [Elusimicrobiota bacterium]